MTGEKISQLSADDLRDMVLSMFDKDPSIMLNIVDRNSQTEIQGYHPRPESNAPSWCVCTKCIELRRRRNDAGKHHKIKHTHYQLVFLSVAFVFIN
ncbi:Hypothetical predicted protein [Mytilus galloprovincialis]|uniref:Uncharacterized protein n=1 Tax=Mytilus galloprovincialis TaxID=29158 RepID=A0A8B6BJW9_MYTGA|nr:Hypothetical predicted protein [Mytilus galloprovincialis]